MLVLIMRTVTLSSCDVVQRCACPVVVPKIISICISVNNSWSRCFTQGANIAG